MSDTTNNSESGNYETVRGELQQQIVSSIRTGTRRYSLVASSWSLLEEAFSNEIQRYKQTIALLQEKLDAQLKSSEETTESNEQEDDKATIQSLRTEIRNLKQKIEIYENDNKLKNDALEQKSEQLNQLTEAHENMISDYEQQIKDSETALKNKTQIIHGQNQDLEKLEKENRLLKKKYNEMKDIIDHLYPIASNYDKVNGVQVIRWVPDDLVNKCEDCNQSFGLTNRKHHCRSCGRIVCTNCSTSVKDYKYYTKPVYICKKCQQSTN